MTGLAGSSSESSSDSSSEDSSEPTSPFGSRLYTIRTHSLSMVEIPAIYQALMILHQVRHPQDLMAPNFLRNVYHLDMFSFTYNKEGKEPPRLGLPLNFPLAMAVTRI